MAKANSVPAERTCSVPSTVSCDGITHAWAVWDEDLNRSVPVDGSCPHRHHNRAVAAYWRERDDGLSHADALAIVRAYGAEF